MVDFKSIFHGEVDIEKITIKNKTTIITTSKDKIVIKKKKNNRDNIVAYLKQRNFDNIVYPINRHENYYVYPYVETINIIEEQKAIDIINLISNMHNKTTFYKETTVDYYKEIYEKLDGEIDYLFNYYNDIVSIIESKVYFSPSQYLLIRNISKVYACFEYLKNELNEWYKLVENKSKVRHCVVHNNLSTDHLLNSKEKNYLINFDRAKFDIPIYDILSFYLNQSNQFNFKELLDLYESKFKLLEEEKKLLFILLSIPKKINISEKSELENTKEVRIFLDYMHKNEELISPYYEVENPKE